jgi:hypothetical protein
MLRRTRRAPVTRIKIPPFSEEGCASRVDTACLTFSNGRHWRRKPSLARRIVKIRITHRKFLDNPTSTSNRIGLEGQHRVVPLADVSICITSKCKGLT